MGLLTQDLEIQEKTGDILKHVFRSKLPPLCACPVTQDGKRGGAAHSLSLVPPI